MKILWVHFEYFNISDSSISKYKNLRSTQRYFYGNGPCTSVGHWIFSGTLTTFSILYGKYYRGTTSVKA